MTATERRARWANPDPQPSVTVLRTVHRNRLKPPFKLGHDKFAGQPVAAKNRPLTGITDPTTISYGYQRKPCRRLQIRGGDRRFRRSGGLQRINGCLWLSLIHISEPTRRTPI